MKEFLEKINNQVNLSMDEMQDAMNQIMSGKVNDIDMESFLIGLNISDIRRGNNCSNDYEREISPN